jgi:hypothetical protein
LNGIDQKYLSEKFGDEFENKIFLSDHPRVSDA